MTHGTPVLLGGRSAPRHRSAAGYLMFAWFPVLVMLLVILRESTAAFGSVMTSPILRSIYESVFGRVQDDAWEITHHYIRKTGHFLGYGTLGLTWLRAFLFTWLGTFRCLAARVWRRWSFQMALCCTAFVAACDEVHQSYIPDRTGLVSDVLLDTAGALVLCGVCTLFWLRRGPRMVVAV